MVNIEPPNDLPDHWHTDFRSLYLECIQARYDQFDEEDYVDDLETGIRKEREHRKLVNLCVFPFNNDPSPLGFKFVRADPLAELNDDLDEGEDGVTNFDFMLWDFGGQAIFGDAKANVQQGPESLLNDIEEQIEDVEENIDHIVGEYIGREPDNIDYVLAVFAGDAADITRKAIEGGYNVITWAVHQMDKNITVNTELPRSEEIPDDEDIDDVRLRIRHSKHQLNERLTNVDTREGSFNVFPESHPVTKLRVLIAAKINDDGWCFVNVEEVVDIVEDELLYLDREECREIADDLIELGRDVDFLRKYEDHEADYKIKSRYTESEGLYQTLERKWIQYKVESTIEGYQDYCYQLAEEELGRQAQLGDFA